MSPTLSGARLEHHAVSIQPNGDGPLKTCPLELHPLTMGMSGVWPAAATTLDAIRTSIVSLPSTRRPASPAQGRGPPAGRTGRSFVPEGSLSRSWRPLPGDLCTVVVAIHIPAVAAAAPASDESPSTLPSGRASTDSGSGAESWARWDPFQGGVVRLGCQHEVGPRHRACLLHEVPLLGLGDPSARIGRLSGTPLPSVPAGPEPGTQESIEDSRSNTGPNLFDRSPASFLEGCGGVWGSSISDDSFISVIVRVPRQATAADAI